MAWGMRQQDDCCSRRGFCCPPISPVQGMVVPQQTPVPGPVDPFNCAIDLGQFQSDWSSEKMIWCCQHHSQGCSANGQEGPAVATYDCNSGFENFVKGWSSHKKYYCCVNAQKGCDGDMTKAEAAGAGFGAGAQHGRGWAPIAAISAGAGAQAGGAQAGAPGAVDPFNCAIDAGHWQTDWSSEKMTWCCSHHGQGCSANGVEAAAVATYDCNSGFENFVKGWSSHKKYYCCTNAHKGCDGAMSEAAASGVGFGAGAQHGKRWAPIAHFNG